MGSRLKRIWLSCWTHSSLFFPFRVINYNNYINLRSRYCSMPCTQGKRECGSSKSWQSNNSYFLVHRMSSFSAQLSVPVNGSGSQYTAGAKRTFSIEYLIFLRRQRFCFLLRRQRNYAKRFTKILAYFHQAYLELLAHSGIRRVPRMFLAHTQLFSIIVHFHFFRFYYCALSFFPFPFAARAHMMSHIDILVYSFSA